MAWTSFIGPKLKINLTIKRNHSQTLLGIKRANWQTKYTAQVFYLLEVMDYPLNGTEELNINPKIIRWAKRKVVSGEKILCYSEK